MKLEEFQECFDYSQCDIADFAEAASQVAESPELVQAANDFLHAEERFWYMLKQHGVTPG